MIRILHIISSNDLAGTERYMLNLLQHASNEIEVSVICPDTGLLRGALKVAGINTIEMSFQLYQLPQTAYSIYRQIRYWKPDIVHIHLGLALLVGAPTARLARIKNVVTTLHFVKPAYASTHYKVFYPFFLGAHKLVNLCLTRMIAISKAVKDETIQREGVSPAKISHIPHGTAFQPKFFTQEERRQAKAELGLDPNHLVVTTVGRLEKEKGYNLLVAALPEILKNYSDVQLLWVGDGSLRQKLEAKIKALDATGNVHFLGFQKQIAPLLALSDIFLLPTPMEGFGLAVLEAMASGLPVVAINAGGPAEIVLNNVTGLLVNPDPAELAQAVCTLLGDPARARAMGREGQCRCATHYTVERMVAQTEQLYFDLLAASQEGVKIPR